MGKLSLLEAAERAARTAGMVSTLVGASVGRDELGDGEVVLLSGPVVVRFLRDRGQDFVDLAPATRARHFHSADDVEIAFGWKTVEEVLAKAEPELLDRVLTRLVSRLPDLARAFAEDRVDSTLRDIEAAAKRRGEAFTARLR